MTRPEKPIDWETVDYMLECGALGTEIAEVFNMHCDTFYRRIQEQYNVGFTEYQSRKRALGEGNLRMAQYKKAVENLDNTMLIWLGKQRLGQSDNQYQKTASSELIEAFAGVIQQFKSAQLSREAIDVTAPSEALPESKPESLVADDSIKKPLRESAFE